MKCMYPMIVRLIIWMRSCGLSEVCGSLSLKSAYIMITSQDGLQIHWVPKICLKVGIRMCFDGD